jgi:hypothetical protein
MDRNPSEGFTLKKILSHDSQRRLDPLNGRGVLVR